MSLAIFSQNSASIIDVPVDIRTGEYHTSTVQLTQYASEGGESITNHAIVDPDSVEIAVEMSNYDEPGNVQGERAKTTIAELRRKQRERLRYDVLTKHILYTEMCLVGISAGNEAPFNGKLVIRLKFQKAPIGTFRTIAIPPSQLPAGGGRDVDKTASSETDAGRQEPVTEENDNRSIAARAADRWSRGE